MPPNSTEPSQPTVAGHMAAPNPLAHTVTRSLRHTGATPSAHNGTSPRSRGIGRRASLERTMAELAMRTALEVLDRRRPTAQVAAILAPTVIAMLARLAVTRTTARSLGSAHLDRLRMRPVEVPAARRGTPDAPTVVDYEVYGTYRRGERTFAFAGQVRRRTLRSHDQWQLTMVQLGER